MSKHRVLVCGGGSIGRRHISNLRALGAQVAYGVVGPDHRIYEDERFKSFPGYSASKAGVIGLTRWLATWWAEDKLRVNCVSPGGVYNGQDPRFVEGYSRRTPVGRMADRHELSGIIFYLLSDASSYCTGQNFIVDGGFTAW